jgi:hypothetical protein
MRRFIDRVNEWFVTRADRLAAWGTRLLRGRGIRRAWLVVGCLLAVLLLAVGAMQATSVLAHEERTERTEVAAGELTGVMVDNDAGSIEVVGVDGADTVVVQARISEGLRSTGHRIGERDGMLVVHGTCPLFAAEWCGVDYTIEVPVDMYVDVSGTEGVRVSDVAGGVNAHSRASAVELARVGGDVTASANQGRLEGTGLTAARVHARANQGSLSLEFAESPREIVAAANQGSVDIVLPEDPDLSYATVTDADQGSVNNRINTSPRSDRSITVEANQGSISITYALP